MQNDQDATTIDLPGLQEPIWHVPPRQESGQDFVMAVAHGHLMFSNDLELVRQVVRQGPAANAASCVRCQKIAQRFDDGPCLWIVRDPKEQNQNRVSPLDLVFQGPGPMAEQLEPEVASLLTQLIPRWDGFHVIGGTAGRGGWRLVSWSE